METLGYIGDYAAGQIVDFHWPSIAQDGHAINRSSSGTIKVYKDSSTSTEVAADVDTAAFDGIVGINYCQIDTSLLPLFFTPGSDFSVVLITATVDGVSISRVLAKFSIENRYLKPVYEVFCSSVYDDTADLLGFCAWLEKDGEPVLDATQVVIKLKDSTTTIVSGLTDTSIGVDGEFFLQSSPHTLNPDENYFLIVKITDADGVVHTSASSPVSWD